MTAVDVRIHASFQGQEDLRRGTTVVGNIYSVDRRGGSLRNVLIPVGVDVTPIRFDLDPGRYVIEVRMPSGVIVGDEVTVTKGKALRVELRADDSPHESHSWQHLAGNLEPAAEYHRPLRPSQIPRSQGARVLTRRQIETGEFAPAGDATQLPSRAWWIPDSREDGWSIMKLNSLASISPTADIRAVEQLVSERPMLHLSEPTESDGRSHLYRFDSRGPIGGPASPYHGARQFVVVEIGADAFLVALPVPWRDPFTGADVQAELMVSTRQNPSGSPIGIAMRDLTVGPALAYMANGALGVAATIFEKVEEMLYMKVRNQFAAAAGAYVLVGTDVSAKPRSWYSWVDNLSRWFGWLPDGAILLGTLRLRTARTKSDVARARKTLLEAYSRGVPIYTLGLRWLVDGLSEFEDDPMCETALRQVRELSWRVDTRQPFVVLRLNSRRPG